MCSFYLPAIFPTKRQFIEEHFQTALHYLQNQNHPRTIPGFQNKSTGLDWKSLAIYFKLKIFHVSPCNLFQVPGDMKFCNFFVLCVSKTA